MNRLFVLFVLRFLQSRFAGRGWYLRERQTTNVSLTCGLEINNKQRTQCCRNSFNISCGQAEILQRAGEARASIFLVFETPFA